MFSRRSTAPAPQPDVYRTAFASSPVGIAVLDLGGIVEEVNLAFCRLSGRAAAELIGCEAAELVHPDDVEAQREQASRLLRGEVNATSFLARLGDTETPVRFALSLVGGRLLVQAEDVGERERLQQRVRFEAEHDPLTGLYNRAAFGAIVQRHITFTRRYERQGALVVVDLDHFHDVNDSHGTAVGDELLRAVAGAIGGRLRDSDVVARLGSDEFGLLLPEVDGPAAVRIVGEVLDAIGARAVQLGHTAVRVTASAGISHFGAGGARTTEHAFTEADVALMAAKEGGRRRAVLHDDRVRVDHAADRLRRSWADKVRRALDAGSFVLDCQPIVNTVSGEPEAYELLLRMVDEDGSVVRPAFFLHVAERFGLMPGIDEWVIARAVGMAAARAAAGAPVTLAVNLSAQSLADPSLLPSAVALLAAHPDAGRHLVFELTERTTAADFERAGAFVARVTEYGCRFALDDFGSGAASFAQLKRLPFDFIKLDGEFTRSLPHSPDDQAIVGALVQVARSLGKTVIAECVEDEEILQALGGFGIELVQGLHIGRPARVSEVLGLEISAA